MYNIIVTVEGFVCDNTNYVNQPNWYACVLPYVPSYQSGQLLDLVVQNDWGTVILPQIIGFTTLPMISSISSCWPDGGLVRSSLMSGRCLAGESITISGMNLLQPQSTASVIIIPNWNTSMTILCLNVSVLSSTAISCILPAVNLSILAFTYNNIESLQVLYSNGNSTNTLSQSIYDYPQNPRISQVSGCGLTSSLSTNLTLSGCSQSAILTLSGMNLNISASYAPTIIRSLYINGTVPVWFCEVLTSSYQTLTCQIPPLAEEVQLVNNLQYTLVVTATRSPSFFYSNSFYVTITTVSPQPPHTNTDNGSNNNVLIIVTTTVIIGLAFLVLILLLRFYRSRLCCFEKRGDHSGRNAAQSMAGSFTDDVELSDA